MHCLEYYPKRHKTSVNKMSTAVYSFRWEEVWTLSKLLALKLLHLTLHGSVLSKYNFCFLAEEMRGKLDEKMFSKHTKSNLLLHDHLKGNTFGEKLWDCTMTKFIYSPDLFLPLHTSSQEVCKSLLQCLLKGKWFHIHNCFKGVKIIISCCCCTHGHCKFTPGVAICSFSRFVKYSFDSHIRMYFHLIATPESLFGHKDTWKLCWHKEEGTLGHEIYWWWNCDKTTFLSI